MEQANSPKLLLNTESITYLHKLLSELTQVLQTKHELTESIVHKIDIVPLDQAAQNTDQLQGFLNSKYNLHQVTLPVSLKSDSEHPYIKSLQDQNAKLRLKIKAKKIYNQKTVELIECYERALNNLIGRLREDINGRHFEVIELTRYQRDIISQRERVYYDRYNEYLEVKAYLVEVSSKVRELLAVIDRGDEWIKVSTQLQNLEKIRELFLERTAQKSDMYLEESDYPT